MMMALTMKNSILLGLAGLLEISIKHSDHGVMEGQSYSYGFQTSLQQNALQWDGVCPAAGVPMSSL
jgi:hypothetical protein